MDISELNNITVDKTISLVHSNNPAIVQFIEQFRNFKQKILTQYSVKVTKDKVLADRVMVAIDYSKDTPVLYTVTGLLALIKQYDFPEICTNLLKRKYSDSVLNTFNVGVGIEIDEDKVRYKVYIEDSSTKNIFAIKWDAETYVITNYTLQDKSLYEDTIFAAGYDIVPQVVTVNLAKLFHVYLTQDTISSNKTSFNLAFNDLYLKDITSDMLNLTSVNILNEFSYLETYPIRVIAGGLDSNNEKYFTLYFTV